MQSHTLQSDYRNSASVLQGFNAQGVSASVKQAPHGDVLETAYSKMGDKVATSLPANRSTAAGQTLSQQGNDFSPQAVTDRIMGFISDRLQQEKANGASDARIQELYGQALKGVENGLRDAKHILQAGGIFAGEVKTNFDSTVNGIADRLQSLGKSLFQSTTPANENTQLQTQSKMTSERRNFSMQVVTRDGDRITLNVASGQSLSRQMAELSTNDFSFTNTNSAYSSYDHFGFQVEGELDAGEMSALKDLFRQVNAVAETFYQGDVEAAFNQALDVGMDVNELSAFAVDLNRTETSVVQNTYTSIDKMSDNPGRQPVRNRLASLGDFSSQIQQAQKTAQTLRSELPNATELLNGLLDSLQSSEASQHARQAFQNWLSNH